MRLYDGDTFEVNGRAFVFKTERDDTMREPWREHDGHGVISEWTSRDKRPGERILCSDRSSRRFYDVQATMTAARRDGWSIQNPPAGATARQCAALAVDADFRRMRAWCNDQWDWVGVIVTDQSTGRDAALWGIESDAGDYFETVARELATEMFPLADAIEAAGLELASD